MSQIILGHDEALIKWASLLLPGGGEIKRPAHAIGVAQGSEILAVAVFNNFCQHNVEVSFAASTPRWATRSNIRGILVYPFRTLGLRRMTAITSKANQRSRKFLVGLGFTLEGTHPFAHDGQHSAISYGLYREVADAKWLGGVPA